MTDSDTRRANRLGVPCPTWCTADHDKIVYTDETTGEPYYRMVHSSVPVRADDHLYVRLVANGHRIIDPMVSVTHAGTGFVPFAGEPERLAELVEMLADVPFQQMMQLGQDLRAAAAILRGEA